MRLHRLAALTAVSLVMAAGPTAAEPPRIIVSIKPLHSLVAAVTDGVTQPQLLIKTGADPHSYAMKPSDAQALNDAQLVVWAGPGVETFLEKPVAALAKKARAVRLDREKTLKLLKAREGGPWSTHDHDRGHDHKHAENDGHLWLDLDNAAAIVRIAVRELSALDKENAPKYAANGDKAVAALKALDDDIRKQLAPLKGKRFVVSHDSIQYFEKRYGLAAAGAISISPERPPSARRLHELRARITRDKVVCVFGEPQVPNSLVKTVVEGTPARTGVLDTDGGMAVPEGKDAYATMMTNLAKSLVGCLS
jgi:zinc transport system substrate-binding protein